MRRSLVLPALIAGTMTLSAAPGQAPDPNLAHARTLHRQVPMVDGHNDFPWEVRTQAGKDITRLDIRAAQPATMTDIPRMRAGGVGGQFWSVYVPPSFEGRGAVTAVLEQIDIVHAMVARYPDVFELATSAADVRRIFKEGRIASLIGMEGGHTIDSSLGVLRMCYRLGARYLTLTHSKNTVWADSATDTPAHHGLTPFGEDVIREMNRLGMIVDLSHVSDDVMRQVLRLTTAPVIFSHSSARALCPHPRNVPDDVLEMLKQNGGVVMVSFVPGFTTPDAMAWDHALDAEYARLEQASPGDPQTLEQGVEAWKAAHPRVRVTVADVADHIDHVRRVAGIDHVGYGSDFDGISAGPTGLEDVSTFPALTAELLRRGYSDEDLKKVIGLNVLRVMEQVERTAKAAAPRT
jgi:membrane dipeptidase